MGPDDTGRAARRPCSEPRFGLSAFPVPERSHRRWGTSSRDRAYRPGPVRVTGSTSYFTSKDPDDQAYACRMLVALHMSPLGSGPVRSNEIRPDTNGPDRLPSTVIRPGERITGSAL